MDYFSNPFFLKVALAQNNQDTILDLIENFPMRSKITMWTCCDSDESLCVHITYLDTTSERKNI